MNFQSLQKIPKGTGALCLILLALTFGTLLHIDFDRVIAMLCVAILLPFVPRGNAARGQGDSTNAALAWGVALVVVINLISTKHVALALVGAAALAGVWSIAIFTKKITEREQRQEWLFAAMATSGAISTIGVWLMLAISGKSEVLPLYIHPRLMGMHLAATSIAAVVWLHFSPLKGKARLAQWLVGIVSCAGMLWSGGRSPMLMLGTGLFFLFWCTEKSQRKTLIIQSVFVLLAGAGLSIANGNDTMGLGFLNAVQRSYEVTNISQFTSTRSDFWAITWEYIKQSPILGHGPEAYRFIEPRLDGHQPHNWVLQWLLDAGVVGGILFATLVFRIVRNGFKAPAGPQQKWSRAAAAGLIGGLAGGLFDGYFYHAQIHISLAVFAGICLAAGCPGQANSKEAMAAQGPSYAFAHRLLLGLAACIVLTHSYLVIVLSSDRPIPSPDSPQAKLVRAFPSWDFGLQRWLEEWAKTDKAVAIEWSDWACENGTTPGFFHYYSAVQYMRLGQFQIALERTQAGLRACHRSLRPYLTSLQNHLLSELAKQDHPLPEPAITDPKDQSESQ